MTKYILVVRVGIIIEENTHAVHFTQRRSEEKRRLIFQLAWDVHVRIVLQQQQHNVAKKKEKTQQPYKIICECGSFIRFEL